jgi:hypothetical protein
MGVGALIDLAAWKPWQVKNCMEQGLIHPDIKRKELAKIKPRTEKQKNREMKPKPVPVRPVLVIKPKGEWSDADQKSLEAVLSGLKDKITFERPPVPNERTTTDPIMRRVGANVRKELDEFKDRHKMIKAVMNSDDPLGNATKLWSDAKDATLAVDLVVNDHLHMVTLPPGSGEYLVRSVLKEMGRAQRYEQIYDEAATYFAKAQLPTEDKVVAEINMINNPEPVVSVVGRKSRIKGGRTLRASKTVTLEAAFKSLAEEAIAEKTLDAKAEALAEARDTVRRDDLKEKLGNQYDPALAIWQLERLAEEVDDKKKPKAKKPKK